MRHDCLGFVVSTRGSRRAGIYGFGTGYGLLLNGRAGGVVIADFGLRIGD
jgi:hypothetical protein